LAGSTVRICTPDAIGSGAFVRADLVVTAAHVIHPADQNQPWDARKISVVLGDGTELTVVARLCTQRWAADLAATADMAILRVGAARPGDVVATASNAAAKNRTVTITGYLEGPNSGTITRSGATDPIFESDDLVFHDGVSGAAVIAANGQAIGIATRSPDSPTDDAFVGIPFLDDNLAWLIQNCPKEDA
jgi:S1-C subfamily serine protease